MERLFETHGVRASRECAPVWTLITLDAGGLERPERVTVPGVWESHPALHNYRGRAVYTQKLFCGGNVRFWLGGVSFRAEVALDDVLLAKHYGAYTGFEALALNLPWGEHTLRVTVDNRFGEDSALHVPNDYYAYGGINRPVIVEELSDAYITSLRVTPWKTGDVWMAEAVVALRNLTPRDINGELTVTIAGREARMNLTLKGGEATEYSIPIPCGDARPWTPEEPTLYGVSAVLWVAGEPVDDLIDRVGFREVRVEGRRILLNGQPLRLKGFNRHEEYGGFGLSVPVEAMARDVHLLRDIGANCVRTCHYPNDPRFLDLCDEAGLLVWEESHARGFSEDAMRHPRFMEQLMACTDEMVRQHGNHPCVFVWGSLNECADDTEYGAECYRAVFRRLRALDASRPVTAALLERPGGKVYGDMDIVGVNLYPLWYHDTPAAEALARKMKEIGENGGANKPVVVSEIGAGAIYGYHDPFGRPKWSEERQCDILRAQIEAALSNPEVSGVFIWQFADVRVDEEWAIHRPKAVNNKGVVDEYRRPKLAYEVVKALFHSL